MKIIKISNENITSIQFLLMNVKLLFDEPVSLLKVIEGNLREKVMLNVKVEATKDKSTEYALPGIISSAFHLLYQEIVEFACPEPMLSLMIALSDHSDEHPRNANTYHHGNE